jgi:hypothetical protein
MFAYEDALQGKTTADAYSSGNQCFFIHAHPGDKVLARLAAGAAAVTRSNFLVSAGDGTLRVMQVNGAQKLYSNTAASAAIVNIAVITAYDKSYTIPANTLQAGDVIRIKAQVIATATNSTDTLVVTLKIGGTTVIATTALDVANGDLGYIEADIVIRTVGASGTLVGTGVWNTGVPGTATTRAFLLASTAIDTTATQAITVSSTWSVQDVGNSSRLDILTVDLLRSSDIGGVPVASAEESVDNSAGVTEAFIKVKVL